MQIRGMNAPLMSDERVYCWSGWHCGTAIYGYIRFKRTTRCKQVADSPGTTEHQLAPIPPSSPATFSFSTVLCITTATLYYYCLLATLPWTFTQNQNLPRSSLPSQHPIPPQFITALKPLSYEELARALSVVPPRQLSSFAAYVVFLSSYLPFLDEMCRC
jgi:hypothetical protein